MHAPRRTISDGDGGEDGSDCDPGAFRGAALVDPGDDDLARLCVASKPHSHPRHRRAPRRVFRAFVRAFFSFFFLAVRRKVHHHGVHAVGGAPRAEQIRGVAKKSRHEEKDAETAPDPRTGRNANCDKPSVRRDTPSHQSRAHAAEHDAYPRGTSEGGDEGSGGERHRTDHPPAAPRVDNDATIAGARVRP